MNEVSTENRHSFFIRRLKELGLYDVDADYGGMIGKAVEDLSLSWSKQGHSGTSAEITLEVFNELMDEYGRGRSTWPIFRRILQERVDQDKKWGRQDHGPDGWLIILMEEVGEASRGALEGDMVRYKKELVQIAAVAVAALEAVAAGAVKFGSLVKCQQEVMAIRDLVTRKENEREQLQVQLAGCSVAALGWSGDAPAKPGEYGWSQSYQDALDLRNKYELLLKELEAKS